MARRVPSHIARVVWDGRVAIALEVEPNLVASGRLPIEFEPEFLQSTYDFAISESSEPARSSGHHNCEVLIFRGRWQRWGTFAFPPRLDEPTSDIARNLQSLGHRPPFARLTPAVVQKLLEKHLPATAPRVFALRLP